jgi:hypothetical protein
VKGNSEFKNTEFKNEHSRLAGWVVILSGNFRSEEAKERRMKEGAFGASF